MKRLLLALITTIFLTGGAIAEMAVKDWIVQANLGPGEIVTPTMDLPLGLVLSDVQIVSNQWPDPELIWSIQVERSFDDGATWAFWFGGSGTGEQSYDKQGNPGMPRLGVRLDGTEPQMKVRAVLSLNKRIRIGLQGITE